MKTEQNEFGNFLTQGDKVALILGTMTRITFGSVN